MIKWPPDNPGGHPPHLLQHERHTMPTWYTHTHLTLPAPLADDSQLLDLTEHLTSFGVSASVTPDNLARITISLAIQATDHLDAANQATTLQSTGPLTGTLITTLTVRTEQDMEDFLNAPSIPELVGLTDIAGMAGISRQRVRDLSIKGSRVPTCSRQHRHHEPVPQGLGQTLGRRPSPHHRTPQDPIKLLAARPKPENHWAIAAVETKKGTNTMHEKSTGTKPCTCGAQASRWHGQRDVTCNRCGTEYKTLGSACVPGGGLTPMSFG